MFLFIGYKHYVSNAINFILGAT